MKKLITLVAIALAFFVQTPAQAQFINKSLGFDTVTNAATAARSIEVKSARTNVTFQLNAAKISGTTAGYWIRYASVDGVNYVNLDSTALVDGTAKTYVKTYFNNPYRYWKSGVAQSGTSVTVYTEWILSW